MAALPGQARLRWHRPGGCGRRQPPQPRVKAEATHVIKLACLAALPRPTRAADERGRLQPSPRSPV
eukprot:5789008-Alexandrium_andersonii.AAC.1